MTAYQDFAALYDSLMDDVDYEAWAKHYERLLSPAPKSRIFELGCGTGNLTVRLAKMGYDIVGTDLSPEMIARAQEKARKSGQKIQFAVQDMTRFSVPRKVPCIFCGCDGVNYLTTEAQVKSCFSRVFEALKPGGTFAFDISAPHKLKSMAGQMYGEDREEVSYLWMNEQKDGLLEMNLTFFVRQESGLYKRFSERHLQRMHEPEELKNWLKQTGFENVAAYSEMTMEPWKETDDRIHFTAKKPEIIR